VTADVSGKTFDVKTVQLGGKATMNGADPANGGDCTSRPSATKATVQLTDAARGYSFTLPMLCGDSGFAFSGAIFPGTYRVTVQGNSYSGLRFSNLPLASYLTDAALAVSADVSGKTLDVKTVQVGGKVTMNGADPTNGGDCASRPTATKASVVLADAGKGYSFTLPLSCGDNDFTFLGTIFPGTYRVTVQGNSYSGLRFSNLPLAAYLADAALVVSGDAMGKVFDVKTVQVGGKVTLNGMDPMTGADCASRPSATKASITLVDSTKDYSFTLPLSCGDSGFAFMGMVFPGTYRVTVQGASYSGLRFTNLPLESSVAAARLQIP
jgi:hypothetical protein